MTAVLGSFPVLEGTLSFHEALKNGVVLCQLINVLQPGSVPTINESRMAFKMVVCLSYTQQVYH